MNTLNAATRLETMALDHFSMSFILMIFVAPGMVFDIMYSFEKANEPKLFLGNLYINIFAFSLYFNKDIYLGRSIGKRVLKFQVVSIRTGKPANPLRCLVRNLTIILWPAELIVALINNERRIGDLIAGTKLTTYYPEQHKAQANWILILTAIITSMLFTYLAMFYPFELLFDGNGRIMY